jgi:hypothetical protein
LGLVELLKILEHALRAPAERLDPAPDFRFHAAMSEGALVMGVEAFES